MLYEEEVVVQEEVTKAQSEDLKTAFDRIVTLAKKNGIPPQGTGRINRYHIIAHQVNEKDIYEIVEGAQSKHISNLKLTFRNENKRNQQGYYSQLLVHGLFQLFQIDHLDISKQTQTIPLSDFTSILEIASNDIYLQKLTITLNYLPMDSERQYNIKLFGQALGYFQELKELNLEVIKCELTEDDVFYLFNGIRDCKQLQNFGVSLSENEVSTKCFSVLKDVIIQAQNLKGLRLKLSFIKNLKEFNDMFNEIMNSMKNLEILSVKYGLHEKHSSSSEELTNISDIKYQITNPKLKALQYSIKENKSDIELKSAKFLPILWNITCQFLTQLDVDLTSSSSIDLQSFAKFIGENSQLLSLKMILPFRENQSNFITEIGLSLESCKHLQSLFLKASKKSIKTIQDFNIFLNLLNRQKDITQLSISIFHNVINNEMMEMFFQEISSFSNLQTLTVNVSTGVIKELQVKSIAKSIQKLSSLRVLVFDMNLHKKAQYQIKKLNIQQQFFYCGTYLLGLAQGRREINSVIAKFKKQIQLSLKKNMRLISVDCLISRLYTSYINNNNYEYYSYLEFEDEVE